ncbi:hypothetical protein SAMN02746095_01669 [Acidocella aminolytica 101 = DSM 11237]|nr:hypothetical protein SAMN02746095_01669 [Acidocella aminolytica 101 = DSM 11237]
MGTLSKTLPCKLFTRAKKRGKARSGLIWGFWMRRLAALFSVLVIIGAGVFLFWPRAQQDVAGTKPVPAPQTQAANHDPRALTDAEQTAFLPLVCSGASGPGGGYAHQCTSLPGYPSQDYGGAGLGLGITLKSVVMGHLTSADADEAYVTYAGSFEAHANNFGGGILFAGGPGHWKLKGWYPGGQAAHCVSLNPDGRAQFVCLSGWEGQGEEDSQLSVESLPPPAGEAPSILSARDLRDTLNPNANCQTLNAGQAVLLSIDSLRPAPGGAVAEISYVSAGAAKSACAAHDFAHAPVKKATLTLRWHDDSMKMSPALNFASAP